MDIPINYQLISDAINYYQELGYKYIDVDWCASPEAIFITKPVQIKGPLVEIDNRYLVASAEQSLLDKILHKELSPGKYVTCSPCFRVGELSETHFPYFLKVELMYFQGENKEACKIKECISNCKIFFEKYLDQVEIQEYEDTIDIEFKGIELGSYGLRHHDKIGYWVFGTGCAEPRLSYCRGLKNA